MFRLIVLFVLSLTIFAIKFPPPLSAVESARSDAGEPPALPDALQPIVRVPPRFPAEAPDSLLKGWVVVEFTLTEEGAVANPRAVRSSDPVLEEAALHSVRRWKFRPAKQNGVPVAKNGVRVVVTFDRSPEATAPQWETVKLPSGRVVTVLTLQLKFSTSGPTRGFRFLIQVKRKPEHADLKEAARVAEEVLKAHFAEGIEKIERSWGRVSRGVVAFVTEPVNVKPGETIDPGILHFRFTRSAKGEWIMLE